MTGRGTPRRHIESARIAGYRLNANESATAFRDRVLFASTFNTLNPTLLVKALGPNLKDSGSGDERAKGDEDESKIPLPVVDAKAKPKPGQVPKLHFSFDELVSNPEGPHIKWVDPFTPPSPQESSAMLQKAFAWKAQNPDPLIVEFGSSEPSEPVEQGTKGLGPTLRELNPRGTIDLAAAIARGVIVDANGKMRCPPGTPNANQFTDEFMTNCVTPSAGRVARFARNVFARLHENEMRGRNIRLARNAGQRLGEAKENIASAEEVAEAAAARSQRVKDTLQSLGVSLSPEFNGDYIEALSILADRGDGPDFKSLFTGGVVGLDGQPFIWDDGKSILENIQEYDRIVGESYDELVLNQMWQQASAALLAAGNTPETFEDFKASLTEKNLEDLKKITTPLAERHQQAMRGFMGSLIDIHSTDPDQLRALKQVAAFVPGDDESLETWWETEGITFPTSVVVDGKQQLGASIGFNPYKLAMEPFIRAVLPDSGAIFKLNPAIANKTESERARLVENAISEIVDAMEFAQAIDFANIVSATRVGNADPSLSFTELRAMHVGYHEFAHVLQYAQAQKVIFDALEANGEIKLYTFDANGMPKVRKVIKKPADGQSLSLDEMQDAMTSLAMSYTGPDDPFPPVNAGILESSMTHLLAGRYYQNEIRNALSIDPTVASEERIRAVKMAVNEATAEIFALQRMGVIRGENIDRVTGWLNEPLIDPVTRPITDDTPGIPWPPRQLDKDYISPARVPATLAQFRDRPAVQQAADMGRMETIKTDASVVVEKMVDSGPRRSSNPFAPKNGEVTNSWSGLSRLIFTDTDTGIGDSSPSSRPAQRRAATAQWADGLFGLPSDAGAGSQYSDMDPDALDRRFELVQSAATELLERESLNPDEQAQLWAAVEDMGNIIEENNFRRLLPEADRTRARRGGRQTIPGVNVSPVSDDETTDALQESIQRSGRDGDTAVQIDTDGLVGVKASIGEHFNQASESAERGAPDYKPDPGSAKQFVGRIREQRAAKLKEQFSSQITMLGEDGVADVVSGRGIPPSDRVPDSLLRSNGDPIEAIRMFASAATRDDSMAVDEPTPDSVSRSLAKELSDVILPAIDRLNKSTFEDDMEVFAVFDTGSDMPLIAGEPIRHGIVSASMTPSDAPGAPGQQLSPTQQRVRIVVRKGDAGTLTADSEGNVGGGMIPPGTLRVTEVGPDGIPVAVISDQKTSTRVAKNLLSRLDASEVDEELATSVGDVKAALDKHIDSQKINPARFQGRGRRGYDAREGRDRQGRGKAASVSDALVESGSTPFRSQSIDSRISSVDRQIESISSLASRLSSLNADPTDDREYELQQRLRQIPDLDIDAELADALTDFASSISDRPRLAISQRDLDQLLFSRTDDGLHPSDIFPDGSPNPFFAARVANDEKLGFSSDSAPALRPMNASIVHSGDIARGERYMESLGSGPLKRNIDYISDSPEFSINQGLSTDTPIDVLMSPTVSERTMLSSSRLDSPGAYAGMTSGSPSELAAALLPFGDDGLDDQDALSMALDIIEARRNGNTDISSIVSVGEQSSPIRAAIVGGVTRDDIDAIRIPIESISQPAEDLNFQDFGFTSEGNAISSLTEAGLSADEAASVLKYASSPSSDLESTRQMRSSRLARFEAGNFGDLSDKVIFTNRDGIDLTDRATFADLPYVKAGDDLDTILTKRNHVELLESAREIADDLASGKRVMPTSPGDRGGMRSRSAIAMRSPAATMVTRIARSDRAMKLLRRAGVQDDDIETIQFLGELATGFAAGGPHGAALVLARAAGRSGFDVAIRKAIDRGLVSEEMARKLIGAADRIAPDALPSRFEQIISDGSKRIDTDALAERARAISAAAREVIDSSDALDSISERVSDMAESARGIAEASDAGERALEFGRGLRRRFGSRRGRGEIESGNEDEFDITDPFGPPSNATNAASSEFDMTDPFGGDMYARQDSVDEDFSWLTEDPYDSVKPPTRATEPLSDDDPFGGEPFGESITSSSSSAASYEYDDDPFGGDPFTSQSTQASPYADDDPFGGDSFSGDSYSGEQSPTSRSRFRRGMRSQSQSSNSRSGRGGVRSQTATASRSDIFPELEPTDDYSSAVRYWSNYQDMAHDLQDSVVERLRGRTAKSSDGSELDDLISEEYGAPAGSVPRQTFGTWSHDSIRELTLGSKLSPDEKDEVLADLDHLSTISRIQSAIRKAERRPNDPFSFDDDETAQKEISPETIGLEIDEAFSRASPGFIERVATLKEKQNERTRAASTRRNAEQQAINAYAEANKYVGGRRQFTPQERTLPVSGTKKTIAPKIDWKTVEPQDGVVRSVDELESIMNGTVAYASDLTEPERIDDLAELLLDTPEVASALKNIIERPPASADGDMSGREMAAALIKARGYDAPAARITKEEADLLGYVGDHRVISRGGTDVPQKSHIENGEYFIGSGVDGAGQYFAVEDAAPSRNVFVHFKAQEYTQDDGGLIIRGVISPDARMGNIAEVTSLVADYRSAVSMGSTAGQLPENPLLALRQRLMSSGTERDMKVLDVLDTLMGPNTTDGDEKHATTIAAVLMGLDGLSGNTNDNRYIMLNRSAMMMVKDPYTKAEWTDASGYSRMSERAKEIAKRLDIPVELEPDEYAEWIRNKTQEFYDAAIAEKSLVGPRNVVSNAYSDSGNRRTFRPCFISTKDDAISRARTRGDKVSANRSIQKVNDRDANR